ncbi:MAG: AsmA-like C-terminal region-containing protein [Methylocystis sp.]
MTHGPRGDAEILSNEVDPTGGRLQAPRFVCAARRVTRACVYLGLGVLAILSMSIGGFLFVLARGPIGFDWLTPVIVKSLDELYAQRYDFGLGGVALASTDHGPTLTAAGLTVKSDGRTIIAAPRAELSVDLSSLLLGRVKLRRLEMLDLELRLAVTPDGQVTISAGTAPQDAVSLDPRAPTPLTPSAPADQGDAADSARLLARGGAALRVLTDLVTSPDSAIGAIDRVGVLHGRLVIDDRTLDRVIRYDDLTLSLEKGRGGMKFSLAATGASRRWTVVATAQGVPGGRRAFEAKAQDFSLDEIALFGGLRNLPFDSDAPLSAQLRFALGENDLVAEASGGITVGAGYFRLDEPDFEPVMIQSISGAAHWDRKNRQFVISPIKVKTGALDMTIEGALAPPAASVSLPPDAAPADGGSWIGSLRLAKPSSLGPERAGQSALALERSSLKLHLSPIQKRLAIEQFELVGPEVNLTGSAAVDWVDGLHVVFGLTSDNTQLQALVRLVSTHVAAPVRNWLIEHVPLGAIRHGEFNADFTQANIIAMRYEQPPPDAAIHAEADLVNVELLDLLPGLPPLRNLSMHLHQTGRTLTLSGASGMLDTPHERRLAFSEGGFVIDDNMLKPAPSALDLRFAGNVEGVAEILTLPSLAPYANLPLDPSQLKGQIDGRLRANIEIGDQARGDHTVVSIEANTTNLSVDRFVGAERLDNGALNIVHDRAGLRVSGTGRLFGGPTTLDIRRAGEEKAVTQAQFSVVLDEAARAKAGYSLPGVVGPITASVKTQLPLSETETPVELDLTRASLDNLAPGVAKPAGKAAKAQFTLVKRADGMTLDHFTLDAGAMQLLGVVELARDGAFRSAKFSQFRLSPGDDAKFEAQRSGDVLKLTVRGNNVDARPFLRSVGEGNGERQAPGAGKGPVSFDDIDLDLKSALVTGYGKQILSNVDFKWERRGNKPRVFSLTGSFGREPLAVALMRNQNGPPQLEISTSDGGSLMSFLALYDRMDSGVLNARVQLSGQGRADGVLHVRDFYLKNEPAMRQLMSQGAPRADDKGVLSFDPEAVRVARLQMNFAWGGGKLALSDGIMSGPEMGLLFEGDADITRDTLDISGSYAPLYGLNNLVTNIPLVGPLITGGAHEGVIALNYRVTGKVSAPIVSVSPASLLTPGLFRKIMGVMDGTARPEAQGR